VKIEKNWQILFQISAKAGYNLERERKGGGTEIDRQSLDFVVPAPRG